MTTLKLTFETVQELQAKKAQLEKEYGQENVITSYGTFEKYDYNVTFSIFQ